MKLLSLFSGIGGIDLGLERAGFKAVGQCEIEPYCLAVLEKHWPKVWRHNDVKTLTGQLVRQNCGPIDIIAGGFPCQDVSVAGKGAGLDGKRSGLWREMLRVVCEVRPNWILAENVPALYSRGYDRVHDDLVAAGYFPRPVVVGVEHIGGGHKRHRVWIVAHANSMREQQSCGSIRIIGERIGNCSQMADTTKQHGCRLFCETYERGGIGKADEIVADSRSGTGNPRSERLGRKKRSNFGGCGTGTIMANAKCVSGRRQGRQGNKKGCEQNGHDARRAQSTGRFEDAGSNGELANAKSRGQRADGGTSGNTGHANQCGEMGDSSGTGREEFNIPAIATESGLNTGSVNETRWPARPGEEQYPWEEPRLIKRPMGDPINGLPSGLVRVTGQDDLAVANKEALKAMGNAVVPQIPEMIGLWIMRANLHGRYH